MSELREVLEHPDLGRLPALKVLDCVFALKPDGRILHHHLEEIDRADGHKEICYRLNGTQPHSERQRCQIIPPRTVEFGEA
ncbi:MAG: hypothetical protein AAF384_02015 [Pseudomonadota bacterium]